MQQSEARSSRRNRKDQGCTTGQKPPDQRAVLRPRHLRIVLGLEHHIQRIGTAGGEEGARSEVQESQSGRGESRERRNRGING